MKKVDGRHLRKLAEDSNPQDLSGEPEEGSKLTELTEQHEGSRSQDAKEQSKGGIQIRLGTSEPPFSEEREDSMTPVSGSWGKTNTDRVDDTSSFLDPEPSTYSHLGFFSSDNSRLEDTQDLAWGEDSQEISELSEHEELPSSLWERTRSGWKFERPGHPVPKQKLSFHSHCCSSVIEQIIKHSPRKLPKSSGRAPRFKGSKIISPRERMQKQRKKESKGFFKAQPPTTGLCKGSRSYLGRRSKALYHLYTTFCDDEEDEDNPGLLQGGEGSTAASGVSRACTIFRVLKNGRINVSNLLLTLHTMGILVGRADMHEALMDIAVDERGHLNFLDFLNVLSLTTPFAGTKALQKSRRVFRKLKKDMVAVEDLEPTLACLGVTLSPTMIKQAIKCIPITWDWKLNISDFLSTVSRLQSRCDKMAYLDESLTVNWRPVGAVNNMDYSEVIRRKGSPSRGVPARQSPMITFCSAEEAVAFTELQRQKSKPHSPVGLKISEASLPVCSTEMIEKKHIIKWPKARQCFGYTSQDTVFPLESTLCSKQTKSAPVQQAETKETVDPSQEDVTSLLPQPKIPNQTKKKRLSFHHDLPKRYSAENVRGPVFTLLEMGDKGSAEEPSAQQPLQ